MSNYVQNLTLLKAKSTHELKEVGDQWRTPDELYWGINAKFGPFTLDLFTDGDNSKCPNFYTAEDNALTQDWSEKLKEIGGSAYANPPYSRSSYNKKQAVTGVRHIMNHALAMREAGGRYVFFLKVATSEVWCQKMQITSVLSAVALGLICRNGSFQLIKNRFHLRPCLLVQLLFLISLGQGKLLITFIVKN